MKKIKITMIGLLLIIMLTGCGIDKRTISTGFSPNCDGSTDITETVRVNGEIVSVDEYTISE